MILTDLLVFQNISIREALAKIDANRSGFVLLMDKKNAVVALATDGDIRRRLIDGGSMDDVILDCANEDFVWFDSQTPRELLLKKLDEKIKFIPLLDINRNLTGIVGNQHFPVQIEEQVYVRSRAPVRVSFGGGGSDLNHYLLGDSGAVINATLAIYSHATLRLRDDMRIIVNSTDLNGTLIAENLKEFLELDGDFGLIQALLKTVQPNFGFELYLSSDFPMKSGLGGSAAISAVVLGCFNHLRRDKWDSYELAELAFQAERVFLGVEGGWQDQYATVFGGVNFMEFQIEKNVIHPLRVPNNIMFELEENLVLCDTGIIHESGNIHNDQKKEMLTNRVREQIKENVRLTYRIRDQLLRGELTEFGQSLDKAWSLKKSFSKKISSKHLDGIYEGALAHGAVGGKLLGAGGGGFFLFYVDTFRKQELIAFLQSKDLHVRPLNFEDHGLRTWSFRVNNKTGNTH
ncbi:hypothetical protein OAT86_00545 [Planktomarina sp.]|nr:hypothetical protein [Planktomarina sp.]